MLNRFIHVLYFFLLSACQANSIANKTIDSQLRPSISGVRIISIQNAKQSFEFAAKLQWNSHYQRWDKVLVLYNGNVQPPSNHPIWTYLVKLEIPQRRARFVGENLYYKAFHRYNDCNDTTWLRQNKMLYISFNSNHLGEYSQEDFARNWNCPEWQMGRHLVAITQGKNAHSGRGLQLTFPQGESGCDKICINWKPNLGGKFNKIQYAYWVKFPSDFDFVLGGKLPGVGSYHAKTGGSKPNGYDGWSVRAMWNQHGQLGQYVYHFDQVNNFGEFMPWSIPSISKGKWHHIKTMIALNSPKQANGTIRTWLDGKLVLNRNNIRFRMIKGLEIERFLFSSFFGGSGKKCAPKKDEQIYLDDFVIKAI